MRIQHNIMAMNAYRNYNNNTSALSKNLERLSSGYKINRAGDDAAGLAISEKMRAQITGLEAAQKNVKDGISLVNTAEGAMQEIQDMLNRMVYLANQSANGTYDNEVDRKNLQKEVDALKAEIDRIAESANFNGTKLLNGDLDTSEGSVVETKSGGETTVATADLLKLPPKGEVLETNTVIHQDASKDGTGTKFSIDLHNTVYANNTGENLKITIGTDEFELTGTGDGALSGADLVEAIKTAIDSDGDGFCEIDGKKCKIETDANGKGDNRISFTQVDIPNDDASVLNGAMPVKLEGQIGSKVGTSDGAAKKAVYSIDLSNANAATLPQNATIDGISIAWDKNLKDTMAKFVDAYNADTASTDYTVAWDDAKGSLTFTAKVAGQVNGSTDGVPSAAPTLANLGTMETTVTQKAEYSLNLTGATSTVLAADKKIDGVAIGTWDTDLDTTMGAFVTAYNNTEGKEYDAAWDTATSTLTLTAKNGGAIGSTAVEGAPTAAPTTDVTFAAATKAVYTAAVTGQSATDGGTITVAGQTLNVKDDGMGDITVAEAADAAQLAAVLANKITDADYDISADDDGNLVFTAKNAGPVGGGNSAPAGAPTTITGLTINLSKAGEAANTTAPATFTEETQGSDGVPEPAGTVTAKEEVAGEDADPNAATVVIGTADYNFETTAITNVGASAGGRLASTRFDLTAEMVSDGGKIKLGNGEYEFSSKLADKDVEGKVYIGDLTDADGNLDIAGNLEKIADRITDAAKSNTTWTVGNKGKQLSFVEVQDQTDYTDDEALISVENIAKTFSWTSAVETETTVEGKGSGSPLRLQIGDDSEPYNRLEVSIKDMHSTSLGLKDVDISSQDGALAAVNVIKAAINTVSEVRGDLGAISNRLDHTANNLSVMRENIQDAESTIRDTDIAEEMMAYTKNNILVQSAQAMLAQANQVPQGVLQLLQ